jgi:glycosyltransferase involved in cell wall biosynthesis
MIAALLRAGVDVMPLMHQHTEMPGWMCDRLGVDWDRLSISCMPPTCVLPAPGRHWMLTMTEGSELPPGWREWIEKANVERLIVPCPHNAEAFRRGGVTCPIHVIPGGTDPDEFPVITDRPERPYTFLALGDRGARKGWVEVWQAFYKAFGTPTDTADVRLVIKVRPDSNDLLDRIADAENPDPRVHIWREDVADMRDVFAAADCFVFPSRSEGWGMPPREAAMMGVPVITQLCSGVDDGYTARWATVITGGTLEAIPSAFEHIAGDWLRADVGALTRAMRYKYNSPAMSALCGTYAAEWLRNNQTWDHAAKRLLDLIGEYS